MAIIEYAVLSAALEDGVGVVGWLGIFFPCRVRVRASGDWGGNFFFW